ncbi:hypothetical protein KI387_006063, partial [Taxus chinensis]
SGIGKSSSSGALSQTISTQFNGTVGVLSIALIDPIRPSGSGGSRSVGSGGP